MTSSHARFECKRYFVPASYGHDTYLVPSNVAQAANFFQRDHLFIKGAKEIRAADPARTKILGNWQVRYKGRKIDTGDDTPTHRRFMGAHSLIEHDTELWNRVVALLSAALSSRD